MIILPSSSGLVVCAPVGHISVMRRQGRWNILSPRSSALYTLGLAPTLPLQSDDDYVVIYFLIERRSVLPVKEYEACNETEVEKKNHNNRGNDGGLRTADVARVSNI